MVALAGGLSVGLSGCGSNCEATIQDALAKVVDPGVNASAEDMCRYEQKRLFVFDEWAPSCEGDKTYYSQARATQETAKVEACCGYLVALAKNCSKSIRRSPIREV